VARTRLVGEGLQYAYSGDPLTAVSDGVCGWNQDASGNYVCCPGTLLSRRSTHFRW
jgi:hypothetical protein